MALASEGKIRAFVNSMELEMASQFGIIVSSTPATGEHSASLINVNEKLGCLTFQTLGAKVLRKYCFIKLSNITNGTER